MNKILALWSIPRGTSTAFSWMMSARGDFECINEPFTNVVYSADLVNTENDADLTQKVNLLESALQKVCGFQEKQPIFIKDFPYITELLWGENFNNLFKHTFLIRHPARTLTSYYKKDPDFTSNESGFKHLRQYYDEINRQSDSTLPVIDSDEMLENPKEILNDWCDVVDIEYIDEALKWKVGEVKEPSGLRCWEDGRFYKEVLQSEGLERQGVRHLPDIALLPKRVQTIYEEVMPHYEYLYDRRLRV